jgi:hypothetical protein
VLVGDHLARILLDVQHRAEELVHPVLLGPGHLDAPIER